MAAYARGMWGYACVYICAYNIEISIFFKRLLYIYTINADIFAMWDYVFVLFYASDMTRSKVFDPLKRK